MLFCELHHFSRAGTIQTAIPNRPPCNISFVLTSIHRSRLKPKTRNCRGSTLVCLCAGMRSNVLRGVCDIRLRFDSVHSDHVKARFHGSPTGRNGPRDKSKKELTPIKIVCSNSHLTSIRKPIGHGCTGKRVHGKRENFLNDFQVVAKSF